MTVTRPSGRSEDLAQFLASAASVMRDLTALASEIEVDGLSVIATGHADGELGPTLQKMDLLLQALSEMERLFARSPEVLSGPTGLDALVSDITLERLRNHFPPHLAQKKKGTAGRDNPLITLFE